MKETLIEVDDTKSNAGKRATGAARDGADASREVAVGAQAVDVSPVEAQSVEAQSSAVHVEPLVLQTDFEAGDRTQFHVAELLDYHDRHFVEGVYRAVLRRAPSASEFALDLDDLRGGRAGKVEIIERLLSSREASVAGRGVRIEGLPSPLMRRLARMPVLGYVLRLVRALVRLPVLMQHQRQFEAYALAQQQLIADYVNERLAHLSMTNAPTTATTAAAPPPSVTPSQHEELVEAVQMFSDALLELSDSHAELQTQTQALQAQTQGLQSQTQGLQSHIEALQQQTQTQVEQAQAALVELTEAITAQQRFAETLRREQQLAADAQQEFLIHEQRVIVETQKVVLEELREELRALDARHERARRQFEAALAALRAPQEETAHTTQENFSGQA
ncbi:MAG TPA: hypothetical protein VGW12_11070 [Pyrinomonadaceae bacterium]|nr:hypothetical protein [Pyrinomonadaceae bacterium]